METRFTIAIGDVERAFSTPQDVVNAPDLTAEQKIELLKQWETDIRGKMVAAEEGMTSANSASEGQDADLLEEIQAQLESVGASDTDAGGVNKAGG